MKDDAKAFVDDLIAVYVKHGLGLESCDDGLEIVSLAYHPYVLEYLETAQDTRAAYVEWLASISCPKAPGPSKVHAWAAGTDPMRCVYCDAEGPPLPGRR